ncbi:hypothetical protein ESCO_005143 [Escovopsis weberi]|uniref:Uncharacterized protein n=1 Tax=Escovopsis weberi TaxID=150374 RepID=A0A0M9VW03_ESCWE|nr:hypothetical protein ESCO_005143 [Escovopsis weberi]
MAETKRKRSADGRDSSGSDSMEIPADLNSRTFKRFRDPRPPEQQVHGKSPHTLGLLYSAQQRPLASAGFHFQGHGQTQPSSSFPSSSAHTSSDTSTHAPDTQQSLHRFWDIKAEPAASAGAGHSAPCAAQPPSGCEDCGAALLADSQSLAAGMDPGMALDGTGLGGDGLEETRCGACGKYVCFSCSVSDLGERRRCLRCAERRGRGRRGGGVGWGAGVSVC